MVNHEGHLFGNPSLFPQVCPLRPPKSPPKSSPAEVLRAGGGHSPATAGRGGSRRAPESRQMWGNSGVSGQILPGYGPQGLLQGNKIHSRCKMPVHLESHLPQSGLKVTLLTIHDSEETSMGNLKAQNTEKWSIWKGGSTCIYIYIYICTRMCMNINIYIYMWYMYALHI